MSRNPSMALVNIAKSDREKMAAVSYWSSHSVCGPANGRPKGLTIGLLKVFRNRSRARLRDSILYAKSEFPSAFFLRLFVTYVPAVNAVLP